MKKKDGADLAQEIALRQAQRAAQADKFLNNLVTKFAP
jgi:hypothetical protein